MRIYILIVLMILWVVGGCEMPDAAYKARVSRLLEVSELMDKGVGNYNSKDFYDKEIEQLDGRYESLEHRWQGYKELEKDKL